MRDVLLMYKVAEGVSVLIKIQVDLVITEN